MAHTDYLEALEFLRNLDSFVVENEEEASRLWADRKLPMAFTSDYGSRWKDFPDTTGVFVDKGGARFRVEALSECAVTYQLASTYRSFEITYSDVIVAKLTWDAFMMKQTTDEQRLPRQVLRQAYINSFLSKMPQARREAILIGDLHLGEDSNTEQANHAVELPNVYVALTHKTNIRVVSIQPALESHEPIRCFLEEKELVPLPDFEALSYVWGSPKERKDIFLNGARFSVTQNLFYALEALRHRESNRVMWIDAICINQSDWKEREYQVAQMDVIYSRAKEVVLWLGPETTTSSKVFASLNRMSDQLGPLVPTGPPTWAEAEHTLATSLDMVTNRNAPFKQLRWGSPSDNPPAIRQGIQDLTESINHDQLHIPPSKRAFESLAILPEAVQAYLNLLQRPYWGRMWVLQEVILAGKIILQCGRQTTDWYHFLTVILTVPKVVLNSIVLDFSTQLRFNLYRKLRGRIKDLYPFMFLHRSLRSADKPAPESLACFLSITAGSRASDPRDRIYGLLGLM